MPWYYAGPEARPVGPIPLEELHARRLNGTILPETYVIEHTGQPDESRAWKRYREAFPANPPLPPLPVLPPPAPPAFSAPPPAPTPHPLFPSAAPAPTQHSGFPPGVPHGHKFSPGTTNPWCSWGFGLGLASFVLLLPTCGLAALVAIPGFFVSLAGLLQVRRHQGQHGRGLALGGLILSVLALLLTLIILAVAIPKIVKEREQTTTEQSTNDSE